MLGLTHNYPEKTVRLKFYRCEWVRNEPRALGCAALVWIDKEELDCYTFPEADATIVHQLKTSWVWP